jgi:lipopolysaccharide/colanic/teichoic acid biosynthesis glycosyltransferase
MTTGVKLRPKPQISSVRETFKLDQLFKRLFDVCAAFGGLLLLSPFFMVWAFQIKRESPGPAFFRGPRMGKDGKVYSILKFRTMREEPSSYAGPVVTAQDDPRVTPLGTWLRETKINELPQLWNVLVGEMSLVGPRPEDPEIVKTWPEAVRREILSVRPGITSPASVLYRDEEKMLRSCTVMDDYLKRVLPDKLRLDQLYVRNHSFLADVDIIFWTLLALLPRLRQNQIPVEAFFNGLLYRFSKRYISWFVIDSFIAFLAVGCAGTLWRWSGPLNIGLPHAIWIAAAMALIFSLINSRLGLGRIVWRYARPFYAFDLAVSSGLSTFSVLIINLWWPGGALLPPGMVIVAGLLALLGFAGARYRKRLLTGLISRWLLHRKQERHILERILIVGAGECGLLANWLLRRSKLSGAFSVIGIVDDNPTKQGMLIDQYPVLGLTRRIPEIVKKHDVGVILFAIEHIDADEQARILRLCHQTLARVIIIPDLMTQFRQSLTEPVRSEARMVLSEAIRAR